MHRIHYPTIIVLAIMITAEVFIISNHGANPFADISRLIVGSIVWVILIMIALLLIFLCTRECPIDKAGLRQRPNR
jgi:Na+-driven multidrug efflux pump